MRDHYKTALESWESLAISKARELKLMEKVADNWQQKAIDANKRADDFILDANNRLDQMEQDCQLMNDIMDEEEKIIGKRIKFSVGHNHIKIIIGNPATYCENYESDKYRIGWSVSLCSHKDVYNWKTGVIKSLDNLCNEKKYTQKLRRDLRKALAKKYPEVFYGTPKNNTRQSTTK
jgi:hypothetical protein